MIIFDKLKKSGIHLDWTTILVGWEGFGKFNRLISSKDIISFASEQLDYNDDNQDIVIQLAISDINETELIGINLYKLSKKENGNVRKSIRKWRLIMLEDLLENLGDDPLYDFIKILEFWSDFDFPLDSPKIIQEKVNVSADEYFTTEGFMNIINIHKTWISEEKKILLTTK